MTCGKELGTGVVGLCPDCQRASLRSQTTAPHTLPDENTDQPPKTTGFSSIGLEQNIEPAGLWVRLLAYCIDAQIACLVASLVLLVFGGLPAVSSSLAESLTRLFTLPASQATLSAICLLILPWFASFLASVAFYWLYFIGFESSPLRATPAKFLLQMFVLTAEGQRVGIVRSAFRNLSKLLFLLPLIALALLLLLSKGSNRADVGAGILLSGSVSILVLIGTYLRIAFSLEKQGLHDLISGCFVMRKQEPDQRRTYIALLLCVVIVLLHASRSPARTFKIPISAQQLHELAGVSPAPTPSPLF
jgi:uncharacterized RDD family membrane protein YckC